MINTRNSFIYAFCLMVVLAACGSQDRSSDAVLNKAPYKELTDSIASFPQQADLYKKRAVMLSLNNKHELATADYQKAWALAPDENTAQEFVANLLLVNKPVEAVALLKESIQKFPENPEFKRRLSEVLIQTGNNDAAQKEYDELLRLDSANFEAWYEKGVLYARTGDTANAIYSLQHAYALQPIYFIGNTLADIYASSMDPRTVPFCDTLIARDSLKQQVEPHFIKGRYYGDSHKYKEALAEFEACIQLDWKFTDAHLEKGLVYYEMKDYHKALDTFTFTTTVSNTNADAWYWIGRCYEAMGDNSKAIENYRKAYALDKDFKEAKDRIEKLK
ncbi:MAG: tetratricopeptide repeat protein [Chitinophagaceae bacterium]|nr:tetratricopeptide repeat protein [Chitinophagaceae bacterium]